MFDSSGLWWVDMLASSSIWFDMLESSCLWWVDIIESSGL